jgi:hypothetical protein
MVGAPHLPAEGDRQGANPTMPIPKAKSAVIATLGVDIFLLERGIAISQG